MTDATQYSVPKEPGRLRSLLFAALVHIALLGFLWIGVHWQSETPATIEAEIWSPQPQEAAPPPRPREESTPRPEPKPEPVKEPPKPKVEEPPKPKVDIALEQEKKRKEEEKKKREEAEEKLAKEKQRLEEKKREEEKLAKLEKEKAEKEKAEKLRKEKEAAEKKRKQQEEEDRQIAKLREENLRRMTGAVGTGGTGEAPKAQGGRASSEYGNRIGAKIKSNITFVAPESLQGNPPVEYEVRLLPDGTVSGMRKLRSSGVPGFDEAVARAIERAQPFPKDSNGSVPSTFIGIHKPKDQ
ncbi:MAG TPA: cell envelope integrity protein TolA [Noviherbaspirillum sp.]|jgi:colicin import membrane protein|uniref:cell envelope integrity protein TolA n=1 Tax=Noviherbaspirillum sp. TaxID=1926288 RepID=UPI002F92E774